MNGADDDFGDGLAPARGYEQDFFEEVFLVVSLDEGYDVGRVRSGIEVSDGYARALTLMSIFPEFPVV